MKRQFLALCLAGPLAAAPIEIPFDPAFDLADEATVEAWVKLPDKDFANGRIVDKSQSFGNAGYYLGIGGNGKFPELAWGTSRGELRIKADQVRIPTGKWIHLAGVFSARKGISKLYLDGKEVASNGTGGMKPLVFTPMPLRLGSSANEPDKIFRGEISRAGIYNVALAEKDIAALAADRAMKPAKHPAMIGDWTLPSAKLPPPRELKGRDAGPDNPLALWYPEPAHDWVEALPVGNGRFGAMIFGKPDFERLQLNDITVWSGGPQPDANRPDAWKNLPEIRKTIREGKFKEAEALVNKSMTCNTGYGASYQTLGDLAINFDLPAAPVTDYIRWLDIDTAVSGVDFRIGGDAYSREVFSSAAGKVLATRVRTSRKGGLDFSVSLSRVQNAETKIEDGDTLVMTGNTGPTLTYEVRSKIIAPGANVTVVGNRLVVRNATDALILTAAGTNYVLDWSKGYKGEDPHEGVVKSLRDAAAKRYDVLKAAHVADYQKLFRRLTLDLGTTAAAKRPTDVRMKNFGRENKDPALATLYYQFARYLMISSSRADNPLPSNSQGIWGDGLDLPWKCDYKSNINYQMNYWPVHSFNLSECSLPAINHIKSMVEPGRKTAAAYYNAPGWNLAMMTNAWGWTSPGSTLSWGVWTGGSGWLLRNFWEHYAFTRDKDFLVSAYPVMKEACEFYLAILIPDEKGRLVVSPSTSPENGFKTPQGTGGSVTEGTTVELAVIWDLFNNTSKACKVLGMDPAFQKQLEETRDRIRPLQIGQYGQLQEWNGDWDRPDDKHRHVSHLYPLHPGDQIEVLAQPELANACRKTLEMRGDEGTGWSKAWKVNFWARLRDGDHAHKLLCDLLVLVGNAGMNMRGGGTYANMFDAHPPFQIDGNFGAPNGMNEMLVQSHETYIDPASPAEDLHVMDLLPALPSVWPDGSITGLRVRGGFELALKWEKGAVKAAKITSTGGTRGRVRHDGKTVDFSIKPGGAIILGPNLQTKGS